VSGDAARVALVTGGAHGIGAAIAARLARGGWRVVVADRDPAGAPPPAGRYAVCDVAGEAAVGSLLGGIAAEEGRLDALICNAGTNVHKPIAQLALDEWSRVIGTNLTSTFLLVRAGEAALRAAKGAVVTIASTRAHMSEPDTEAYAASKGGLVALTHALAVSLGPDVRVNCISPGWIFTKGDPPRAEDHAFHPAGRVGAPDDIAALAAWLAGPDSGFVTGAEFVVDGGVTRKMIYPE
jgi:NAD(P)-dependent dehydrogenase (short-subunit alcohol dehydrogenase family)